MAKAATPAAWVAVLIALWIYSQSFQALGAAAEPAPQKQDASMHAVSVQFDYDFGKHPACTEKPALKTCIKEFDVYDVSGGKYKLFAIPVPKDAKGFVKGITGKSPMREFMPGIHFISVTAEDAQGVESATSAARVQVEIKADASESGGASTK